MAFLQKYSFGVRVAAYLGLNIIVCLLIIAMDVFIFKGSIKWMYIGIVFVALTLLDILVFDKKEQEKYQAKQREKQQQDKYGNYR